MRFIKDAPSIVTGKYHVNDAAHISVPRREGKRIIYSGKGHHNTRAFNAVPLEPHLHRAQYPDSLDAIGASAFFALHDIPLEVVYGTIAYYIATFFRDLLLETD